MSKIKVASFFLGHGVDLHYHRPISLFASHFAVYLSLLSFLKQQLLKSVIIQLISALARNESSSTE